MPISPPASALAPVAGTAAATEDLGPLAWVLAEVQKSLDGASKLLRRFSREAGNVPEIDGGPLRLARAQLHQAVGALQMVGHAAPARVLGAMEFATQSFVLEPVRCTDASVQKIERAGFAVADFLQALLAGKKVSPVALFPQYRDVLELVGNERVHPADLWPEPWRWVELPRPSTASTLVYDPAVRSKLDRELLKVVRSGDDHAARRLHELCLGLARGATTRQISSFWMLAAAFFEALGLALVPADVYAKRAASRVLLQYATLSRGDQTVSERLAQDLLFFCAQAVPHTRDEAPTLRSVRIAWGLSDELAVDYASEQFGRFDPTALTQARKRIESAKETWSALSGGDMGRLRQATDTFGQLSESLQKLHPASLPLAQALTNAVDASVRSGRPPATELAMEVATSVLYLEAAFEDLDPHDRQLTARTVQLAGRIQRARASERSEPLEPWMEELYRRVSDRQTMGTVVDELRAHLAELEKSLDQFFRRPNEKGLLRDVPSQLMQMRGVFSVLGLDQAGQTVACMRDTVERLMASDAPPEASADFDSLGNNLGALGFLNDMLGYQPQLAKRLFVFDPEAGELKPLMGRQAEESEPVTGGDPAHAEPTVASSSASVKGVDSLISPEEVDAQIAMRLAELQSKSKKAASPIEVFGSASDSWTARITGPAPIDGLADTEVTELEEDDLQNIFLEEAREVLHNGLAAVAALGSEPTDSAELTVLRRAFHTLKGSSRMVGLTEFGEAAWAFEQVLNTWLADQRPVTPHLLGGTGKALREFSGWVDAIASGQPHSWQPEPFVQAAAQLRAGESTPMIAPHAGADALAIAARRIAAEPPALPPLPSLELDLNFSASAPAPADAAPVTQEGFPSTDFLDFEGRPTAEPQASDTVLAGPEDFDFLATQHAPAIDLGLPAAARDAVTAPEAQRSRIDAEPVTPRLTQPSQAEPGTPPLDDAAWAPFAQSDFAATPPHAKTQESQPSEPAALIESPLEVAVSEPVPQEAIAAMPAAPEAPAPESAREALPGRAESVAEALSAQAGGPRDTEPKVSQADEGQGTDAVTPVPVAAAFESRASGQHARAATEAPLELPVGASPAEAGVSGKFASEAESESDADASLGIEAAAAPVTPSAEFEAGDASADDAIKAIGPLRIGIALYNVYLNEADEWSRRLATEVGEWALEPHQRVPDSTVALAHSLAGSSATVGFQGLSHMARLFESALQHLHIRGGGNAEQGQTLISAAEELRRLLHQFAAGFLKEPSNETLERLRQVAESTAPSSALAAPLKLVVPARRYDAEATLEEEDLEEPIDLQDAVDPDLFPIFEEEAAELLPALGAALRQWAQGPQDSAPRASTLRTLHTLKGSARLAGAMRLGERAHRMESAIEAIGSENVQRIEVERLLARFDAMQTAFDHLRATDGVVEQAEPSRPERDEAAQAASVAEAVLSPGAEPGAAETVTPSAAEPAAQPAAVASGKSARRPTVALPTPATLAPLRPLASQAVRIRTHHLDRLVTQAGEVIITRSRLESELAQLRTSLHDLTGNLDRLRHQLRDIELQAESQMQSRLAQAKDSQQGFDPLEFDRFTRVQELTRMMAESVNDVATVQRTLQKTVQATEDDLSAQARQTRELQRGLLRTRMVEFEGLSERLYRVVRQASKETGKQVKLDITGGSIEMDRGVLDRMTPAFEHLLRNSVAHGIEDAATREHAGKDGVGLIAIDLSHDGNDVSVTFRDDGAGLDAQRIAERARSLGLIEADRTLGADEAVEMIFRPGFSTAAQVSELAGRGIGMDVVRAEVAALGGRIETHSTPGQGTSFKLVLPLTTAVTHVVMLRVGETSIGVPSNLIELVQRVGSAELETAYGSQRYSYAGEQVPFFWAGALLQSSARSERAPGRANTVVVVRSAAQRLALHVDEVQGNQEVVVKNLGPQLARLPGMAGISVLASGAVALIYNPVALAAVHGEAARALQASAVAPAAAVKLAGGAAAQAPALPQQATAHVPLVLVVDDSITVRRVTQRLLQREGYRVALAADGLQALSRLQEERPSVVLSDIEMPRMDGFDLARNIRADEALAGLPIIMITSRIAEKHREHAKQLGVDHYLGKPYSEDELLRLVRRYSNVESPAALAA